MSDDRSILVVNGGSSSIRFALYRADDPLEPRLSGHVERLGRGGTTLRIVEAPGGRTSEVDLVESNHRSATETIVAWLEARDELSTIEAVGHRVVHGMDRTAPEHVTPALIAALRQLEAIDPDHLPAEIDMMEFVATRLPSLPQVVCFDTAFHHTLPRVAQQLAIPRRYDAKGIRRYGFHGLSYAYLMEELARLTPDPRALRRVVLAHLGSGASMAAVRNGRSIDTTMGFTPTAGLPMSTRSGDLDPGLAAYLERSERMTADAFFRMASHESGLLGISETSADMRDLLAAEATDHRAAEAVALFCYQAKKCVGAYAAALGGIDTLVFAGGIGENAAVVRERICDGLGFLGVELDAGRNAAHAAVISNDASRVTIRVIRTDEQRMVATSVFRLLHPTTDEGAPQ